MKWIKTQVPRREVGQAHVISNEVNCSVEEVYGALLTQALDLSRGDENLIEFRRALETYRVQSGR